MIRRRAAHFAFTFFFISLIFGGRIAQADRPAGISIDVGLAEGPEGVALSLQILGLLTILTLAPAILVLMTSFTRIVVVLSFVRSALATNQMPPNQVIVGLAIFLTAFVMTPTWQAVYGEAIAPLLAEEIDQAEALQRAVEPVRDFDDATRAGAGPGVVYRNRRRRPSRIARRRSFCVAVPAFVISELKTAFTLGFIVFIPFLVIDMIVASTLMSMGMLSARPR